VWRISLPLLTLLALIALALAFDRPLPRADFVAVNNGEVSTLDPAQMSWLQDFRAARLIFEGLTASDVFSPDYDTIPAAAKSWEVSADGLEYTFHIRPDAVWSNGRPVESADFKFAWRRMLLPELGADYAKLVRLIRGADDFYKWRLARLAEFAQDTRGLSGDERRALAHSLWEETLAEFESLVAIDASDPQTLRVTLARPVPYFLSLTAFAPFYPLPREVLAGYESIDPESAQLRTDPTWTKPGALVSNGPFLLTRWAFKREMRFEVSPTYWNRAAIAISSISMPTIESGNSSVLAFRTGVVDWASDVLPPYRADMLAAKRAFHEEHAAEVAALKAQGLDPIEIDRRLPPDDRTHIHAFPAFGTYFYNFNCRPRLADGRPNPFADARVRRAFAMTINKAALVEHVRRSGEPAATTLIPPGSLPGYESPHGLPFDPAAARALLIEAGYGPARPFPTVEVIFNADGGHELIAQSISKDWQRHLGVNVTLGQKEIRVFREHVKSGNFMVSRGTWFGDYGDPTTFLDISRAGDGNNDRGYADDEYEALMEAAANELDAGARLRILSQAERLLMEQDVPMAPIFHYVQVYLFDPHRVSGITPHPRQEQYLHLVDVLGDGRGLDRARRFERVDPEQ
jgi:oligopeptide transport system substrate-binding protein